MMILGCSVSLDRCSLKRIVSTDITGAGGSTRNVYDRSAGCLVLSPQQIPIYPSLPGKMGTTYKHVSFILIQLHYKYPMTSGLQHQVVKFQNKYPHLPIYGSETFSERRFLTNVCKPKLCFFYITTDSPQSIQLIDQHLGRLLFTFNRQGLTPVAHNHPHYH